MMVDNFNVTRKNERFCCLLRKDVISNVNTLAYLPYCRPQSRTFIIDRRVINEEYKVWKKNTPFLYGT